MRYKPQDRPGERGAVTAEFAITIPAVLLVLGIAIGGIHLAAQRIALTSLTAEIARLEARGDHASASARIAAATGSPEITRALESDVLCVTARASPSRGLLAPLTITAISCAARTHPDPGTTQ